MSTSTEATDLSTHPTHGVGGGSSLFHALPGELADGETRRFWIIAVDDFRAHEATWPWGGWITSPRGTRLRYDQRDYDAWWRHEGWDRF